jgi:hypothetical protein
MSTYIYNYSLKVLSQKHKPTYPCIHIPIHVEEKLTLRSGKYQNNGVGSNAALCRAGEEKYDNIKQKNK